jgi:hypothetical protein
VPHIEHGGKASTISAHSHAKFQLIADSDVTLQLSVLQSDHTFPLALSRVQ